MGSICWDFPFLGTASLSGKNNAAITMFRGSGIMDGLVREIIQNSLDARDDTLDQNLPVKVRFKLIRLKKDNFPVFTGLAEALAGAKDYWEGSRNRTDDILKFLAGVQSTLDQEEIPMLIMSDFNTTGLNGMRSTGDEKNFWDILVNTEGISIKQNDSSAGSFGIGKNAPFAYSGLSTVFYNTLAKDGGQGFEGVCHLVTTQRTYADGTFKPTQSTGKYLNLVDQFTGKPILPNDHEPLADIPEFRRATCGTDVAIAGFKEAEYPEWEKNTAIAVLKNFVLAIKDGKLEVSVESPDVSYQIDKEHIEKLLIEIFKNEDQLQYTRQIFETITEENPVRKKIAEEGDLDIYQKYKDGYSGAISRFRSTGMLINTTKESLPHYNVVIVVNDVGEKELSVTLRAAEPPQHTEWKDKNITDDLNLRRKAKKYLKKIKEAVQEVLDSAEAVTLTEQMDGGIGSFLPANNGQETNEEADALRTDVKINRIVSARGRVFYNRQLESAGAATGADTGTGGILNGKKIHKKRIKKRIKVVNPTDHSENTTGVSSGPGKVRTVSLTNVRYRIFYLAGNKYRFIVKLDQPVDRMFIEFSAGRDDKKFDKLVVKNIKVEGLPLLDVNAERVGPISLPAKTNVLYVEFDNHEYMAVAPSFMKEIG